MAAPTISSASITAGILTVAGANFSAKTNAAPFFYQDYSTHDGASDPDFTYWGYANQRTNGSNFSGLSTVTADLSRGRTAGRGTLKLEIHAGDHDYFPHISVDTGSDGTTTLESLNADELYVGFWWKLELISGTAASGNIQIKGPRSGYGTIGSDYYNDDPRYTIHFFPTGDLTAYGNSGGTTGGTYIEPIKAPGSSAAGPSGERYNTAQNSAWNVSGWNFIQIHQKLNTAGVSDGFIKVYINGTYIQSDIDPANFSAISVRDVTESAKHFVFAMLVPGLDIPGYSADSSYRFLISEHYLDTTPQRVMLGNASTLAATTGGLLAIPSAWADTLGVGSITAAATNIPSGYDYVYITNAAGETNSTGFAYTGGSPGAFQAAWANNSNQIIGASQ